RHIDAIEAWIKNLGPWSIMVFVGLFIVATSFIVPDTVLSIMAGALFGLGWGIAAVVVGSLLAAALQYALAQRLLRSRIERALAARPSMAAIQRAVSRNEVRLQALLRLTPLNPAMITYMLGAAGVRFAGFLFACLALVPNLVIEVYFGYAGKHVAGMAGRDTHAAHFHDLTIIGGLAVTILVMVFVSRTARKAVMDAVSETVTEPGVATE
ncbi:MAG TPA: VTT domain-containing protein, partial [Phycisphaerae bacterium]|nr:VTT domain-containing protein [Phycisphaerae bacterium]